MSERTADGMAPARAIDPGQAPAVDEHGATHGPGAASSRVIRFGGDRQATMRSHACFACGDLNVHGLQLALHFEGQSCWVETTLDRRFAGWEGVAHGGILCAILDEVMAWALVAEDCWGYTAKLSVDFRRPVAIGQTIRAEGRLVGRRRRAFRTEGRILEPGSGELLASAEAVYLDAPADRKADLKRRYDFRILPQRTPEDPAAAPRPAAEPGPNVAATEPSSASRAGNERDVP